MIEDMGYGQERLKDIVENEAEEEPAATKEDEEAKGQRQGPAEAQNDRRMMMMNDMIRLQK